MPHSLSLSFGALFFFFFLGKHWCTLSFLCFGIFNPDLYGTTSMGLCSLQALRGGPSCIILSLQLKQHIRTRILNHNWKSNYFTSFFFFYRKSNYCTLIRHAYDNCLDLVKAIPCVVLFIIKFSLSNQSTGHGREKQAQ